MDFNENAMEKYEHTNGESHGERTMANDHVRLTETYKKMEKESGRGQLCQLKETYKKKKMEFKSPVMDFTSAQRHEWQHSQSTTTSKTP